MAGAKFTKHLRLINELGYAIDNMHAEGTPPPSKHIVSYTAWMQGSYF